MRCSAVVGTPDGRQVVLGHGDFIGRLWNAALVVDDPRVSEAHAMVSLRGHELTLIALRGRFAVNGKPLERAVLRPGLTVSLARGLDLEVREVILPPAALGLEVGDLPARVIPGTSSLLGGSEPGLGPPGHPDAVAHVWALPDGWRLQAVGGAPEPMEHGGTWELGGAVWRAVLIPLGGPAQPTVPDPGHGGSLRIVARYDVVHLHREGRSPVVVAGQSARVVSELAAFGCPVPWTTLASVLWPEGYSRKQFDMALVRLRAKLRDAGVRTDLVRAEGAGVVELFLLPGDAVEDQA